MTLYGNNNIQNIMKIYESPVATELELLVTNAILSASNETMIVSEVETDGWLN